MITCRAVAQNMLLIVEKQHTGGRDPISRFRERIICFCDCMLVTAKKSSRCSLSGPSMSAFSSTNTQVSDSWSLPLSTMSAQTCRVPRGLFRVRCFPHSSDTQLFLRKVRFPLRMRSTLRRSTQTRALNRRTGQPVDPASLCGHHAADLFNLLALHYGCVALYCIREVPGGAQC